MPEVNAGKTLLSWRGGAATIVCNGECARAQHDAIDCRIPNASQSLDHRWRARKSVPQMNAAGALVPGVTLRMACSRRPLRNVGRHALRIAAFAPKGLVTHQRVGRRISVAS